jgi:membrane dipeptidase
MIVLRSLAVAALAAAVATPLAAQDDAALAKARAFLASRPIVDGHNDLPWEIRTNPTSRMDVAKYPLRTRAPGQTDFARLKQGGVGAQFWSVYIPGEVKDSGYARMQLEQIDIARRMIAMYPDELELALTAADVERIMKTEKVASLLGMEGGHAIENSLGALRMYHALGVRYMTLTHNVTLNWADAAADIARYEGLTDFGREVVREMNRLGMIVDLSHVSIATMHDALDESKAPIIFSHSSARALRDHPRNVPDEVLRRLPANGGVVMVTFVTGFLVDGKRSTVADVANHIEHIRRVAGIDHVGIGGDYDGTSDLPEGMEDVSGYPVLFAELIRRGWTEAELDKLARTNVLRVLRGAEVTRDRLAVGAR